MKVTLAPVHGTRYTVHDGAQVIGMPTARCAVISVRRVKWHILPGNAQTTCKRCLKIRETRPYIHNRTLAEETR